MGKDGPGQDHNTVHARAHADAADVDHAAAAAADAFDRAWETLAASSAAAGTDAPSTSVEAQAQAQPQTPSRTRADVQRDLDAATIAARQWNAASVDVSDETADLLLLALRLQDELPRDLPDPAFRSALLAQLLEQAATEHAAQVAERAQPAPVHAATAAYATHARPAARSVATPTVPPSGSRRMAAASAGGSGSRAGSPPRFPYMRAIAAIAAVMVAAISVGTLAIWMNDDDSTPGGIAGGSQTATAQVALNTVSGEPTSSSDVAVIEPTSDVGSSSGQESTTPASDTGQPTASDDPAATIASEQTPVPISTAATTTEAAPTTTNPTDPTATALETPTAVATAPGQPTVILLANVPPVDAAHVEQGPVPGADGGGPTPPRDDTIVMLDTAMPASEASAPLYRLSPPAIPPAVLVQEVANALGIDGDATETQGIDGGSEWAVSDDTGAHFQWDPISGAFSFAAATDDTAPTGGIDPSEALTIARQWLESIGYPVNEMTTAEPSALDPTLWMVNLGVDAVPHPGLGHPIGVTAHVDLDGNVVSASGYWLTVTMEEDAPLIALEDAWVVITDCKGIWTGGGIVGAGGDFRVDAIDVSYLLTTLGDSKLVLQPVYRATGEFTASDGSSARVSVYVQAVRDK